MPEQRLLAAGVARGKVANSQPALPAGARVGREAADAAETPATTARAAAMMMSEVFMTIPFRSGSP